MSSEKYGRIGVVLPRSALAAKGSEAFRRELFARIKTTDVVTLQNTGGWVFEDIHQQYTIGLVSVARSGTGDRGIVLQGPFASPESFRDGMAKDVQRFPEEEVLNWSANAALPLLPTSESIETFLQLRQAPSLGRNIPSQWRARPLQEINATFDADIMDFSGDCPDGFWKVYKGASFDLWDPDTGEYNAKGDPDVILPRLQAKRLKANKGAKDSVHSEFSRNHVEDPNTLSAHHSRIAFRDITNRTNSRTVIACLLPPKTFITNKGPVVLFPRGDAKDEAFLLGMLCSIPLDWYARRFVETNLNFFIFNSLPIPRPERSNSLWQRTVELAARLACPDERFANWAAATWTVCCPLAPDKKEDMIYELDAVVALLYGLSEAQLVHIYTTFHEGWEYAPRLSAVRKHFCAWAGKA